MSIKRLMSATALVGILGAIPSVTFAQTAPSTSTNSVEPAANTIQTGDPSDNPSNDGEIVVTGSRIARPTLSSPVPVTTISAQDLLSTGTLNIGDA
ncbi:hypothetical protein [Sphingomonas sp. Ant H11]|nr:hypothetical protein [Sphingomonas sp. Ant H11]